MGEGLVEDVVNRRPRTCSVGPLTPPGKSLQQEAAPGACSSPVEFGGRGKSCSRPTLLGGGTWNRPHRSCITGCGLRRPRSQPHMLLPLKLPHAARAADSGRSPRTSPRLKRLSRKVGTGSICTKATHLCKQCF